MELLDILNFDRRELANDLAEGLRLEPFRASQIIRWVYRKRFCSFEEMSDIAKPVREQLAERYCISRPKVEEIQVSKDGTRKYLFRLSDRALIESVLIKQETRYTLCVSSQVGCAIGCSFCRTGRMGFKRNLKSSEILGQVLFVQDDVAKLLGDSPNPESDLFQNIVFMGMGEPLHNYANVLRAVRVLNDNVGFNFTSRRITVSTSGLVPAIKKFTAAEAGANLAVSLNATTDEVRDTLIPLNKKWPIKKLLDTLKEAPLRKRERITIEYVLLSGVNDTEQDLDRLPGLLKGMAVKVNLIPYNTNAQLGYTSPKSSHVLYWQQSLLDAGLNSTIRWSKGEDISAACGQLATEPKNAGGRKELVQIESPEDLIDSEEE